MSTPSEQLIVTAPPHVSIGLLSYRGQNMRCALGRSGIVRSKREGDGATPAGQWPLSRVLYRPDRLAPPQTALPVLSLSPDDGWCDDPADPAYNRPVKLPYASRAEAMWRGDGLYDVVVVLGYNLDPVVPGHGSAIFLHLARPDYAPTEGCVAVSRADMFDILRHSGPNSAMLIRA